MPPWIQSLLTMLLLASLIPGLAKANILQENRYSKNSVLICHSFMMLEGWAKDPTFDIIQLTGYLQTDSSLAKTRISGAYRADQDQTRPLSPEENEKGLFISYQKVRNSFCWFQPKLPVDLALKSSHQTMTGYLTYACDDVVIPSTLELNCFVKDIDKSLF